MKPVLITGAAGFAGGHLLDLIGGARSEVVAWRRPGGAAPRPVPGVTWQAVDLLNREAVREALAEVRPRQIYHCAGAAHVGQSWKNVEPTFATNVRGTHHLVEGLVELGVGCRMLITSSALVYLASNRPLTEDDVLAPASPYALSKLAQELVGVNNPPEVEVIVARAFNHFGPRQDPSFVASGFARRIADIEAGRRAPEISVGNLEPRRDLTDVRDTVRAYRTMIERGAPGRVYNVCSGRAIQIRGLLDLLLARARVRIEVKVDPARYRPNDLPLLLGDPGRTRQELGWQAEIPLERSLDDLLEFWRGQ